MSPLENATSFMCVTWREEMSRECCKISIAACTLLKVYLHSLCLLIIHYNFLGSYSNFKYQQREWIISSLLMH